ncbi:MAG: TraR/DksA C4-type zinc finger protein [Bacillaceae bacterium]|nr:TraR/DksA C4-type zinc finger protein [Bacillaceae bacterium]
MDRTQLEQLKAQLLEEKDEIERRLQHNHHYDLESSMGDAIKEFSMYDNHPADIGTEMFEREKDLTLNENDEHHLQQIEEAFRRIAEGTYGICLTCGKEIPFERMQAQPTARYCVDHAVDDHVSRDRPVEEEFLQPPFGRTSLDKQGDDTQFDGEDAWQAVAHYGTSNPADFFHDGLDYNDMYIESDEPIGYVDQVEGFIITDEDGGAGEEYDVADNQAYHRYVDRDEGEGIVRGDEDAWD